MKMYFFFSHINNIYLKNQNEKEKKKNGPTWGPNKEEMKFGFLRPLVIVERGVVIGPGIGPGNVGFKDPCLTAWLTDITYLYLLYIDFHKIFDRSSSRHFVYIFHKTPDSFSYLYYTDHVHLYKL